MMGGHAVRDAAGYFHDSDRNLKSDIKPISGLSIIEKLNGYTFTLKRDGRKSSGIVAQELETVMPQAVLTDEKTGRKQVEYDQIIAPLIEAAKGVRDARHRTDAANITGNLSFCDPKTRN